MPRFEVLASILTTPEGRHRKGAVVDLPDEQAEHALAYGGVRPVGDEESAVDGSGGDTSTGDSSSVNGSGERSGEGNADGGEPKPPAQSEPKSAFVDYVVEQLGVDRVQAEDMSKADLVALTRQ